MLFAIFVDLHGEYRVAANLLQLSSGKNLLRVKVDHDPSFGIEQSVHCRSTFSFLKRENARELTNRRSTIAGPEADGLFPTGWVIRR